MDEIRRKLEQIDKQLAGGRGFAGFHNQIVSTAPVLFCAVGLIAGVVIQSTFGLPVYVWLIVLGVCAVTVTYFVLRSSHRYIAYMTLVCFVCLGGIRLAHYEQPSSNDIRDFVGDERELAAVRGRIVTEPYINRNKGWLRSSFN